MLNNGPLSEATAKFYLSQVVSAVIYAGKNTGQPHPNLTVSNILMESNRNSLLCGWSNSLQSTRSNSFSVGEMALIFMTGRSPFISKDIKRDQYGKLLTDKLIHKFWEQIEKFMKRVDKNFRFS